jgi:hypothetical protein
MHGDEFSKSEGVEVSTRSTPQGLESFCSANERRNLRGWQPISLRRSIYDLFGKKEFGNKEFGNKEFGNNELGKSTINFIESGHVNRGIAGFYNFYQPELV